MKTPRNFRWDDCRSDLCLRGMDDNFTDLPRYAQDYTPSQRERVIQFYMKLPLEKGRLSLRKRQGLAEQQIKMAHDQGKDEACLCQQTIHKLLTEAVARKTA